MTGDRDDSTPVEQPDRSVLLDRMTDAFFGLDDQWRFTYLNERGRAVIDEASRSEWSIADLEGRNMWEVVPDAEGTVFHRRYAEAMETQETVEFEAYYEPLDTWFDVRAYPSETGLSVFFRDVTEEHRQRDRLANRREVLQEVVEVVAEQGATFDERVERLLAIGRRELGTKYATLSQVHDNDYVFEIVQAPEGTIEDGDAAELGATNCEQVVTQRATWSTRDVAEEHPELTDKAGFEEWGISCYLGTPVTVDGSVYGTFCFYDTGTREEPFDDWERTLVELMARWVSSALEREVATSRLERRNERLEQFAAILSHDLRNPLDVAEKRLGLLAEECDSEHVDAIVQSHERMGELVEDVLAMVRAGETVEETRPVDLGDVARTAWAGVPTEGATLAVVDEVTVEADPSRLQRGLENLFRNSVEHGPTDSRTRSDDSVERGSTSGQHAARSHDATADGPATAGDTGGGDGSSLRVEVGAVPGGFYVADDGRGIPVDERDDVLEFGYSTAEDGTGVGLGIVASVAEAHGWTLTVGGGTPDSEAGARFEFSTVPGREAETGQTEG